MNFDKLKEDFLPKYLASGNERFYQFLLVHALNKLVSILKKEHKNVLITPEMEFLSYYDQFIILYRREGEAIYLDIAKVFRRAAHKVYRIMLKKNMTTRNEKFLNLV